MFDVIAISTYLTVSVLFWYTGLIPDLAVVRDGPTGLRRKIYGFFSLGWAGTHRQWHHYGGRLPALAALATPLVISVHSVVSWDFALSIVPGWHSTIFAPYFVAGAIHSGLAMVLTLLIPAAAHFQFEHLITMNLGEPRQDHHPDRPDRGLFLPDRIFHGLVRWERGRTWHLRMAERQGTMPCLSG